MTLYSYTTAEQVAGLRNGDPLFTKVTTDSGDRGYLFDILAAVAKRGSAAAALLEGPRYEKGRFAWPFLAGTRISPEDYGDEIIAMTLKPEAIVAYVGAEHGDISFIDSTGSRLTDDEALAIPERIGAVFFFNGEAIFSGTVGSGCYGATTNRAVAYREFYLGNIDMVAEWSLGTQAIVDRLRDEAADLRGLVADLDCTGMVGPSCADIVDAWVLHRDKRVDCILASLAFASESGYPVARLGTLADELEALVFTPNPFVGAGAGSSQP
ncbi:hypothetical protein AKJ09_08200 [Labilithrix luteola]|uniref:Uncharacterized protein n=2 Tax=Labilithrix luteola TaxID=1391654 RepID=A0A0K1Q7A0_9BACT|nr:hypothetical protein AKJ09_08200 [Labilithrix luteola]